MTSSNVNSYMNYMNSLPTDLQALFAFSSDVHSTNLQQNSGSISIVLHLKQLSMAISLLNIIVQICGIKPLRVE